MPKRRGRKSVAQTPAPRSERIYGSKKNAPGSAASKKSAAKIVLSDEIIDALKKKMEEFNEKHPNNKVTLADLKAVFRRGAGAYSKTHRPTITGGRPNSRNAWAYARVNKFLLKKAGKKVKAAYVQDDDLLAKGGEIKFNDKELLAKYKRGESIGFTGVAHLKAKGLIPRADGTKRKSEKYLEDGGEFPVYAEGGLSLQASPFKSWRFPDEIRKEELHKKIINSPEFKEWFGDSKIVDKNGEPKIMFHGSDAKDIRVFNPQGNNPKAYNSSSIDYSFFSEEFGEANRYGKNVKRYYIKSLKPFDAHNLSEYEKKDLDNFVQENKGYLIDIIKKQNVQQIDYEEFLADNGLTDSNEIEIIEHLLYRSADDWWILESPNFQKYIKSNGYDSFVTHESGTRNVAVYDPKQIKLADGTNTTFDSNSRDVRFDEGGYILIRNEAYDTSETKRRLPYIGVSAFCIAEGDFDRLKDYAQREEGVAPENWTKLDQSGFDHFRICAMKMEDTNDYVMEFSDEKPNREAYDPEKHSLTFDEEGNLDYDDAYEILVEPMPKYLNGGLMAITFNETIDTAKNVNEIVEYALEENVNPKELTLDKFNQKVNKEQKYSNFEVKLAYRELKKYFKHGGQPENKQNMEITCQKCGWSWDSADSSPADVNVCHQCGYDNGQPVGDTIEMNSPAFLRALEFAKEDAKTDMELHKVTENAIKLSKDGRIEMDEYDDLVKMAKHGIRVDDDQFTDQNERLPQFPTQKPYTLWVLDYSDRTGGGWNFESVDQAILYAKNMGILSHDAKKSSFDIRDSYDGKLLLNKRDIKAVLSGQKQLDDFRYDEGGTVQEYEIQDFIEKEKEEAHALLLSNMTKIGKVLICKAKIDLAKNKGKETNSGLEKNAWGFVENLWKECQNDVINNFCFQYEKGGEMDCGCGKMKDGGLAYGNSHDKGGMPLTVESTGQKIEIEGGEGVVNKRSMKIDKKVEFQGKKMTPCEVVSKINEMGGGVKFKCDDVKTIIAEDGNF